MEQIQWNSLYDIDNEIINNQHKNLLQIINKLIALREQPENKKTVESIIEDLSDYVVEHFDSEEQIMKDIGFPHLERHKLSHAQLIEQVLDFQKSFKNGDENLTLEILVFLKEWLINHILKEDMIINDHIKKQK